MIHSNETKSTRVSFYFDLGQGPIGGFQRLNNIFQFLSATNFDYKHFPIRRKDSLATECIIMYLCVRTMYLPVDIYKRK